MPLLAYVHADDSERPGRPPWEPNWKVWRWVGAAVVVAYAASRADGAMEALLVLVVFALACRALAELVPSGDGLREWRQ
jgi:hypothetical protein